MKIIVPIRARSRNELLSLVEKVKGRADVLEIWLDQIHWMESYTKDLKEKEPNVQLLGVCKTIEEGGTFSKDAAKKIQILENFLESGGDWVDLDINKNELKTVKTIPSEKLWLSLHDFNGMPESLDEMYKMMQFFRPHGYKFALTPKSSEDLKHFVEFAQSLQPRYSYYSSTPKPNLICTTMGERFGKSGREEFQQKELTWGGFYALTDDHKTASGQPTLEDLET